jgi:hypothetical protein
MWAPIIAWCALETLAESIDAEKPEHIALESFDRLRLRQPLGESFKALGFEGEAGWRAAARIKVVLLAQAEMARETPIENAKLSATPAKTDLKPTAESTVVPDVDRPAKSVASGIPEPIVCGIPRELWSDPDVRWLTGVHDAGESTYVVCEPYEELLWWLQMPELLSIAGQITPSKSEVRALSARVHGSSAAAEKAGYRLQTMLGVATKDAGVATNPIVSEAEASGEVAKAEDSRQEHSHADPLKNAEELPAKPNK